MYYSSRNVVQLDFLVYLLAFTHIPPLSNAQILHIVNVIYCRYLSFTPMRLYNYVQSISEETLDLLPCCKTPTAFINPLHGYFSFFFFFLLCIISFFCTLYTKTLNRMMIVCRNISHAGLFSPKTLQFLFVHNKKPV